MTYSLDKVGLGVRYVVSRDASFSNRFSARNVDEVHAGIRDRESIERGGGEAAEYPVGVHVRQGLEYLQISFEWRKRVPGSGVGVYAR